MVIDENEFENLCNFFNKYLDETINESFLKKNEHKIKLIFLVTII